MPTVLLQEIRDLLTTFLTAINTKIEAILTKLDALDELDDMADDIADIADAADSIDSKLNNTNSYLFDIKENTGAVVTPTVNIKTNTDTLVTNSTGIKNDLDSIIQYLPTISTNSGKTAAYTEDTATNTLDIYNKVVTMASDTTQMRADNQTIIQILNQIYDKL